MVNRKLRRAFTLVEILIVVVILGILAAIVVPQFASATEQASQVAVQDQLSKIRRAIAIYYFRNGARYPQIVEGDGTWGQLITVNSGYMRQPPVNNWVAGSNARTIKFGTGPDSSYQTSYGWIFNPATGDVWAASYDAQDQPLPKS